jgi:hypothetical protein
MDLGIGANLNGFLPFQGTTATLYGPSAWNYQVSNGTSLIGGATIDPNSAAIISEISSNNSTSGTPSKLHPDFGPAGGMPYTIVDTTTQPFVNIYGLVGGTNPPTGAGTIDQANDTQSDDVVEPAPADAPIEGEQANCLSYPANGQGENYYFGDTHMMIIDRNQCFLYETYLTSECDGQISATGQALWDLEYGEVRPYGWTSTDAAGLPVWPGLVKYDEAASGTINHAFRFTVTRTKGDNNGGYFVFPAGHGASGGYNYKYLNPMGMRIILKPSVDISTFSTINQTILTAMKEYGLILADNGSNMFVSGTTDARWSTDDLGDWHGGSLTGAGAVDCGSAGYATGNSCYLTSADFEVITMSPQGVNTVPSEPTIDGDVGAEASYMDANSAPYTVAAVETGTPLGGTGPEGTALSGGGAYETNGVSTTGSVPVITSFEAQNTTTFLGIVIPYGGNICGGTTAIGDTIEFTAHVTGSNYNYIDQAGPFRVTGGVGTLVHTFTNNQTFTLYSMNASGQAISGTAGSPVSCTIKATSGGFLPVPVLAPATGSYNTVISVTISDPGYPGAVIYYTTDQSVPAYPVPVGSTEQIYTGAIVITNTSNLPCGAPGSAGCNYLTGEEINAIAVDPLFTDPSTVGSAVYVVNSAAVAPVITPPSGTYTMPLTVTFTDATNPIDLSQGEVTYVYYTTDGSAPGGTLGTPTGTSQVCQIGANTGGTDCAGDYSLPAGSFALPTGAMVQADADALGYTLSAVTSVTYNETLTATPVISPPSGTYASPLSITITDSTAGAVIYYTTNGTVPTTSSTVYTGAFSPSQDGAITVEAIAVAPGYLPSAVATTSYGAIFELTVTPTSLTIPSNGNAGEVGVKVTSENGYTGTVNLSCDSSTLPPGDVCVFSPISVSVTPTAAGISTLTISAGQNAHNNSFPLLPGGATLAVALCFFGLRKRRSLQLLVLLAASVIGLGLFTGCGTPGSVPNTVTVTIIGTDANGGPVVNAYLTLTQMQSQ